MIPAFRITADNQEITAAIAARFISLELTDEAGENNDSFDLTLDDSAPILAAPSKGMELRVYLGYQETGVYLMGVFVVDEVTLSGPPSRLAIKAQAANVSDSTTLTGMAASLKSQKSRSWHDTTFGAIFSGIAAEHGYSPKIDAGFAALHVDHIDQVDESDMNFLSRLANRWDAVFKVTNASLLFLPASSVIKSTSGEALPVLVVNGPLSETPTAMDWDLTLADREDFPRVRAFYHDHDAGERVAVDAGEGDPVKILETDEPNYVEASRAAWAELARLNRGKATAEISLPGEPLAVAEMVARLAGFRPEFNGTWSIQRAVHSLDESGYTTSLELETLSDE